VATDSSGEAESIFVQTLTLSTPSISQEDAWAALRSIAAHCHLALPLSVTWRDGRAVVSESKDGDLVIVSAEDATWLASRPLSSEARELLDVCLPLCAGAGAESLVVAHLGQSIDGRVATPAGESPEITGIEDVRFTHRMRALFDAVVVGATTAVVDDPRLTTRLVSGDHPARVVLDPQGRVPHARNVFNDGKARTLLITGAGSAHRHAGLGGHVEVVGVPLEDGELPLRVVLDELRARGLRRVFIEGGGVTVSRFLAAGLVDRLEVAVAPRIIGTGDPAITMVDTASALRGAHCRKFFLGDDVLFDFDLRRTRPSEAPRSSRS
jgi:diaminohydroxyphosphoribosylaminopyrimidine deaminase/5-amino-6-(5-phosphoribosylamino)uracil reductase